VNKYKAGQFDVLSDLELEIDTIKEVILGEIPFDDLVDDINDIHENLTGCLNELHDVFEGLDKLLDSTSAVPSDLREAITKLCNWTRRKSEL